LFNLFIEEIIKETKEKTNCVRINGKQVHSIRFADDIALVGESEDNMNLMLNTLSRIMDKFHMEINATKTKTMTARRDQIYTQLSIKLNNIVIQEIDHLCYLGSTITYNNESTIDIKKTNNSGQTNIHEEYSLLTSKHFNIETKKKFIKTFV